MFYKATKDGAVVDVFTHLTYVRYLPEHNVMIACRREKSQAILASDGKTFWHVYGQYHLHIDGYQTVELEEIQQEEYEQLKSKMGKVV